MKATGVIRRIDELGRIVIPKEIRTNLRIREGDNLEIYIHENESIVLKKHSAMIGMKDFASILVDSIYTDIKKNIMITDTDKVLAVAGKEKKQYIDKSLSDDIVEAIKRREKRIEKHFKPLKICDKQEEMTYILNTIIVNGDAVGMVIIFDRENVVSEAESIVASIISTFLEKQLAC